MLAALLLLVLQQYNVPFSPRVTGGGSNPVVESWELTESTAHAITMDITRPSGVAADDLLLLLLVMEATTGTAPQWADDLTGFTYIGEDGDSLSDVYAGMYRRIATGDSNDPDPVQPTWRSLGDYFGYYVRISGANTTTPVADWSCQNTTTSSTSHAAPSVTASTDASLAVYLLGFDGDDGDPFGQPSGWTEVDEANCSGGTSGCGGVWGWQNVDTGATGDATISSSVSDGSATCQIVINPE